MFNINDNKRYKMFFDPLSRSNCKVAGSWEIVDDSMNFSLLLDNSKPAWVNLLMTVHGPIQECNNFNLRVSVISQLHGSDENLIRKIGEDFAIAFDHPTSVLDSCDYEIALKIEPSELWAGMHYVYPLVYAECDGENLGVICKGTKVAVQVLSLTY